MKFYSSQRVLHNVQYNPPCNYYNVQKISDNKVMYGSLAGPRLLNDDKNTFGYAQRFDDRSSKLVPGPGNYFDAKKQLVYDFKNDLKNPKSFLKNTFRLPQQNPSIPFKVLSEDNLDQEDKVFLKQLSLIQNPAKALQNVKKKEPSYSFAKSPRKILPTREQQKRQSKKQKSKIGGANFDKQQEEAQFFEPIFQQKEKNNKDDKKGLISQSQAIRKASKKRNQIINNIGPDFVPSLELIDLMSKMRTRYVPGPGYYNPKLNDSLSNAIDKLAQSGNKGAIFSTVKRFEVSQKIAVGPGSYDLKNETLSKKGGLISKQSRSLLNIKDKKDIQFRFYINPDAGSNISTKPTPQRSSSCSNFRKRNLSEVNPLSSGFGSSCKRFSTASTLNNQEDKRSTVSEYQIQKKNAFKVQLKARLKKMQNQDRRSTKQDSGLLGISTMASVID